jgi:hypothetical protein
MYRLSEQMTRNDEENNRKLDHASFDAQLGRLVVIITPIERHAKVYPQQDRKNRPHHHVVEPCTDGNNGCFIVVERTVYAQSFLGFAGDGNLFMIESGARFQKRLLQLLKNGVDHLDEESCSTVNEGTI